MENLIDDQELNDLLDFTKNLDYDKYINDLEVNFIIILKVKTVVEALKKRIEEIRIENP